MDRSGTEISVEEIFGEGDQVFVTTLFSIRDGKIASERIFLDREEALEAAGLRAYRLHRLDPVSVG